MEIKEYKEKLLSNNAGTLQEKLSKANLSQDIIKEFKIINKVLKSIYKDNYDIIVLLSDVFVIKVKLDRVRIARIEKNGEINGHHVIRNLFVEYYLSLNDKHVYFKTKMGLKRNIFTEAEYKSNYVHSHINECPTDLSNEYKILSGYNSIDFCFGNSMIKNYINDVNNAFESGEDIAYRLTKLFIYVDLSYLTVESETGVPYRYISKIYNRNEDEDFERISDNDIIEALKYFFKYLTENDINIPVYWNNDKLNVRRKKLKEIVYDYCQNEYLNNDSIPYLVKLFSRKEKTSESFIDTKAVGTLKGVLKYLKSKETNKESKKRTIILEKINKDITSAVFFKNEFLDVYVKKVISNKDLSMNYEMIDKIKNDLYLNKALIDNVEFYINVLTINY